MSTKENILQVATQLFAKQGFNGTSIRDIAKEADVNLGAINYHFKNKENLYFEVFNRNHQLMAEEIRLIGSDEMIDTRELVWRIYESFQKNSDGLLNTFRIFLSENLTCNTELACFSENEFEIGPPGMDTLLQKITQDVGEDTPMAARHWAMRMIFGNLIHFGLLTSIPFFREKTKNVSFFNPKQKKKSFYLLVESILTSIEEHPENWS